MTSVIDELKENECKVRREAAKVYRRLLGRAGKPKPGDAEALADAMRVLGRTAADADRDAGLVGRLDALERQAAKMDELQAEARATHAALADAVRKAEEKRAALEAELKSGLDAAAAAARKARGALDAAQRARGELPRWQDAWRAIVEGVTPDDIRARRRQERFASQNPSFHGPGARRDKIAAPR